MQIADAVFDPGQDKGLDFADVNLVARQAVPQDHILVVQNDIILCERPVQNQGVLTFAPRNAVHIARDADDVIVRPQIDTAHVGTRGDRHHIGPTKGLH